MPYKLTTPLEAQCSKWRKGRSSMPTTVQTPARTLKRRADEMGIKSEEWPRKRARIEEAFEMDVDVDEFRDPGEMDVVGMAQERWVAVDEYSQPLLGFGPDPGSTSGEYVGLSRYAIDVECIIRQGFGDGSDREIAVELYRRFRPCGNIRDLCFADRHGSSITTARIVFEDGDSVGKALGFGVSRLGYQVGDSMRRLWVKRATYTPGEWTIIPESQAISAEDRARRTRTTPLLDICQSHQDLQNLTNEAGLPISASTPFVDLEDLPPRFWPDAPFKRQGYPPTRKSLKSQNEAFDISRLKSTRY